MTFVSTAEVLDYLRPEGGIYQVGDEYEGIEFRECEPFTQAEYEAAFDIVAKLKEQKAKEAEEKKAAAIAKLSALGLDLDEIKALGLG